MPSLRHFNEYFKIKISSDHTNKISDNKGRSSVRIHSNDKFNDGLFIFDLDHMPTGPGTWPAYWLCGQNWPNNGEIDILEGVDGNNFNSMTLHTNEGCYMPDDRSLFTGHFAKGPQGKDANDCFIHAQGNFTRILRGEMSRNIEDGYKRG